MGEKLLCLTICKIIFGFISFFATFNSSSQIDIFWTKGHRITVQTCETYCYANDMVHCYIVVNGCPTVHTHTNIVHTFTWRRWCLGFSFSFFFFCCHPYADYYYVVSNHLVLVLQFNQQTGIMYPFMFMFISTICLSNVARLQQQITISFIRNMLYAKRKWWPKTMILAFIMIFFSRCFRIFFFFGIFAVGNSFISHDYVNDGPKKNPLFTLQ